MACPIHIRTLVMGQSLFIEKAQLKEKNTFELFLFILGQTKVLKVPYCDLADSVQTFFRFN